MRDTNIVTVYKNKGDRSDCNNYQGISLLNIAGKAFARVTLVHLQTLASCIYPESQCGFRAGWSTVDMIFSLCQLQEKCPEQQMPLYVAFIDLKKAFDWLVEAVYSGFYRRTAAPHNCWLSSPHFTITCTARFALRVQHLSPFPSAAESNKAVSRLARLNQRVWNNANLTERTKLRVYKACALSTLLYNSEAWTTHARHEEKLKSFHW